MLAAREVVVVIVIAQNRVIIIITQNEIEKPSTRIRCEGGVVVVVTTQNGINNPSTHVSSEGGGHRCCCFPEWSHHCCHHLEQNEEPLHLR